MPRSSSRDPNIPWDGVEALARHWVGAASLFDWLASPNWDIDRAWSTEEIKARAAYALLLRYRETVFPYLPRTPSEWLDLLEQEIQRPQRLTELPSAHTDWAATLSEFGGYPSPLYIERRPHGTFDTALTRTLKWFCRAVDCAEELVRRVLGQQPLAPEIRSSLQHAMSLTEIQGAADTIDLSEYDAGASVDRGAQWSLIGTGARQLATLWNGRMADQLLLLAPMLPELDAYLFELGTLGAAALTLRTANPHATWRSRVPLGAARSRMPALMSEDDDVVWKFYYQIVPHSVTRADGPYRSLTAFLGGGPLRPDIWITSTRSSPIELLIECKFSVDKSYVAQGVAQILAYWEEYPPQAGVERLHMVVCPDAVVERATSWKQRLALGTVVHMRQLIQAIHNDRVDDLLRTWAV